MATRPKILLLDDEKDLVESYASLLESIPSQPEVFACTTGSRALALFSSESIDLFITDLRMPSIDGLQMLSVVRRKYPHTRTVVLTALSDEQFRARSYAMGADIYWQKPDSREGLETFRDCIESLLQHTPLSGFRGVQNKSLVDIIQLECLSQNSSTLHVVREGKVANIWMENGNVIDAQVGGLSGEIAFREIMLWKAGNFELLPPDPGHPRVIQSSYQGLLLDSAQALDEGRREEFPQNVPAPPTTPLALLKGFEGVEFLLSLSEARELDSWGVENADDLASWISLMDQSFRDLGDRLEVGEASQIHAVSSRHRIVLVGRGRALLCVGFKADIEAEQATAIVKPILSKWIS